MQNWSRKLVCAIVLATLVALLVPALAAAATPERYIVTFDSADHSAAAKQIAKLGGVKVKDLWIIDGAVFKLPSRAAAGKVRALAGVRTVELDVVQYAYKGKTPPAPPAESVPWGVDKIDADLVWSSYLLRGAGVNVGIIDTGIDIDHPDLAANVKGGWNCIAETANFDDDNGHGSHVSGTVAGVDNTIGVIGVAPSANLYGIKVLNRSGRGTTSDIIEGMQWAVGHGMDVINMSLGTSSYVEAYEIATDAVLDAGVIMVCSAGNSGPDGEHGRLPGRVRGRHRRGRHRQRRRGRVVQQPRPAGRRRGAGREHLLDDEERWLRDHVRHLHGGSARDRHRGPHAGVRRPERGRHVDAARS